MERNIQILNRKDHCLVKKNTRISKTATEKHSYLSVSRLIDESLWSKIKVITITK